MTTAVLPSPSKPSPIQLPEPPAGFTNAAELLDMLGGIPPNRVRMSPAPGTATDEDLMVAAATKTALLELIDGVLVEKPMGLAEGLLAAWIIGYITRYLETNRVAEVFSESAMYKMTAGNIRVPDVSVIIHSRLPKNGRTPPVPKLSPDLAIEVLSPSNTDSEMEKKRAELFAGGTRVMWIIDPSSRSAKIHRINQAQPTAVGIEGTLSGEDILPGFQLALATLFAQVPAEWAD